MSCTEAEESVGNDLTATKTQIKHINKNTNSVSDEVNNLISEADQKTEGETEEAALL